MALIPPALKQLQTAHPRLRLEVAELEPDVALPAIVDGDYELIIAEEYPGNPLPRRPETSSDSIC